MNKKDSFANRAGDFFAGKGFYIVLILCVAVIGASAWAMLANNGTDDGLSIPVVNELDEMAELPPRVPVMATPGIQERETPTPQPEDRETWWGREEAVEPTPEPPAATPPPATPPQEVVEEVRPTQFVWPVGGTVEVPHSVDALIFDQTMGDWRTHAGIDISADLGERVRAIAPGIVKDIVHHDLLGTMVIIDHGGGLQSLYANLAELPTVEVGQWVDMGTFIGAVGNTALAEVGVVTHLHLEIMDNGVRVDPLLFLPPR